MSTNTVSDLLGSGSDRETASRILGAILDRVQPAHERSRSDEFHRVTGRHHRVSRTTLYGSQIISLVISRNMASDQEMDRRQAEHNEHELSPLFVLPHTTEIADLPISNRNASRSMIRGQPRSVRPYLNRLFHRNRSDLRESVPDGYADLQNTGHQLEHARSNLRALLDDSVSESSISNSESQTVDSDSRRTKRRKVDSDNLDSIFNGFSYGKYGQVEPGKLKMEILSCDGGVFEGTDTHYSAENILETDNSVYCTKSNRCNLILRHQGATVFCLKELCIRTPYSSYTPSVQEGMVFISMTSDDLLTRTAQYQIQYSPSYPTQGLRNNDLPRIMSIRYGEDGFITSAQNRFRRLFNISRQDEECDHRTAQIPRDFINENAPPFSVTTECSDSDGDESSSRSAIERSAQVAIRFASSDESDGYEDEVPSHPWHEDYVRRMNHNNRRRSSREISRNIALSNMAPSPPTHSQDIGKSVEGGLMAPHARFFIERDKSKCTVNFDPPVSGRFILLKMWSPHHDVSRNIDIQSVVAIGYAGPRYFPAVNRI